MGGISTLDKIMWVDRISLWTFLMLTVAKIGNFKLFNKKKLPFCQLNLFENHPTEEQQLAQLH